jgi:nucleolar complex protein 3
MKNKKVKQKAPVVEVSDGSEEMSVHEEDMDFVNQLTEAQLKFFTSSMDPSVFKTPLEELEEMEEGKESEEEESEEEEEEEGEEDVQQAPQEAEKSKPKAVAKVEDLVRHTPKGWEEETHAQNMLPIKRKGKVMQQSLTAEDIEERKRLEKKRDARKAEAAALEAGGKKKPKRRLGDPEPQPEPEPESAETLRLMAERQEMEELRLFQERLDQIPNKQMEIQTLSTKIIASPQEELAENIPLLLALCVDDDVVVKQLAVLSCGAVFANLMPAYRIREDNEERADNAVLSKSVKKLRRYERGYLHQYRLFVDLLTSILVLKEPNPMSKEEAKKPVDPRKQKPFRVNTLKALHQMQLIATKALAQVLLSNVSFNYSDSLVQMLVPCADWTSICGGALCKVAIETIVSLFEKRNELEQIYFTVLEIGRYVKRRKFNANPDLLRTFLQLVISDAITDIDIRSAFERGDKKKVSKHESKKDKKLRKFGKMVDKKVREAESERRQSEVQKFQRQMAQSMFLSYFRVLKTATSSPLLPAVLEGIARWCHLLNVDFMFEIVNALLKLLQQASLPLHSVFYCAITTFQALQNSGDVFQIDLSAYYHFVYPRLLQLPFVGWMDEDWERESVEEVAIQCLQLMISSKSYRMATRSAAFAKRLATVSIHSPPNAGIAFLQLCRRIMATDTRLEQLIDPEELGTADVFSANIEDPDNSHPFSTSLFELLLLQDHYHPHMQLFAEQMLDGSGIAPNDPRDFLSSYDWNTIIFNPPFEEPGPTRFDKKLKKLAKYDSVKKAKFSASLIPPPPHQPSEFATRVQLESESWFEQFF